MIASMRRSLGAKILLLAALNLALLALIGLAASGVRVPRSFPELIIQSAEPRLQDVARRIALDVERTSAADGDALLEHYATEYRTRFMLVRNDGTRIAGAVLDVPDVVKQALSNRPRASEGGPAFRRQEPGGPRPLPPGAPPPPGGLRMPQTPADMVRDPASSAVWLIIRTPIRFAGDVDIIAGSLLIAPYNLLRDPLLFPLRPLLWIVLAVAVTALCWWPMLRSITRSLRRMEHATSEIAHGRFGTRIDVSRDDEIGRLAASIEEMARRLDAMVSGQKRFLGDTAHELRSPLGRMQVALEILAQRGSGPDRGYVNDLKEDVEELRQLTDDLLQYARAELAPRSGAHQSVPVRPIVDRVIAKEAKGATILVEDFEDAPAQGDALLIERAVSNVIRNAVKYAADAGPIIVSSRVDDRLVSVCVADSGPGVASESIGRLFEPFYRADEARARKTGGVGLGLAIVRSAIEACGGSVSCRNREPRGFEVLLNLNRF